MSKDSTYAVTDYAADQTTSSLALSATISLGIGLGIFFVSPSAVVKERHPFVPNPNISAFSKHDWELDIPTNLSEKEAVKEEFLVLEKLAKKIIEESTSIDPEIVSIVDRNFSALLLS